MGEHHRTVKHASQPTGLAHHADWAAKVGGTKRTVGTLAEQVDLSVPIKTFTRDCAAEASTTQFGEFSELSEQRLMHALNLAITMGSVQTALTSSKIDADTFATAVCTGLRNQANTYQKLNSEPGTYAFMLHPTEHNGYALRTSIKTPVRAFAKQYFNDHWPAVREAIAEQRSPKN